MSDKSTDIKAMNRTHLKVSKQISPQSNIIAAGTAAAISAIAVQPLDVLKTRLQVSSLPRHAHQPLHGVSRNLSGIFKAEGVRGLYRGLFPSLVSVVPSVSIYFTLYSEIKRALGVKPEAGMRTAATQSVAAGIASCCTAVITNPLWVVKTRMQTQPHSSALGPQYKNSWHTVRSIMKHEGPKGLYKGLGASLITSSQAMVQFPVYETLKLSMCKRYETDASHAAVCFFVASSVAASLACVATYPSEVVRSRMQVQGMRIHSLHVQGIPAAFPHQHYTSTFHAFRTIWFEEGARGLYRGMLTNLIRLVPAHAISFTVYEAILRATGYGNHWSHK